LVWLPADFLCQTCINQFQDSSFMTSLADDRVPTWASRLHLRTSSEPAKAREQVAYQHHLLRLRNELMDLSRQDSVFFQETAHLSRAHGHETNVG
jgi:hypothetical protein